MRTEYTLGEIGGHNVVVAVTPEIGNNAAATVATQLLNDFHLGPVRSPGRHWRRRRNVSRYRVITEDQNRAQWQYGSLDEKYFVLPKIPLTIDKYAESDMRQGELPPLF